MFKETNLAPANAYYCVTEPFACSIVIGCAETQTYIGRSMVLQKVYRRINAQPGDEVHHLYGGLFLVCLAEQRSYPVELVPLNTHPFLKQYMAPYEKWPIEKLAPIPKEAATHLERHDTLQTIDPSDSAANGWFVSW